MSLVIRPETPADATAIRALLTAAFGTERVGYLVDLLRASAGYRPDLALVAEDKSGVVGHIMLTAAPLHREDGSVLDVLVLSPLAVRPDRHSTGIGRALTEQGLALADLRGEPLVVLEGDPALYQRFGFEAASRHGLRRPSPTIPEPAFQVRTLSSYRTDIRGQIGYPTAFWAAGGAGLPEPVETTGIYAVAWLFEFARYAGWIESVAATIDLSREVRACPGMTAGDLLSHLGTTYRVVAGWIERGRRPVDVAGPDGDVRSWFATGWRELYAVLAATPARTQTSGWCPWDTTNGFWRRRMVHETAIHAGDMVAAAGDQGPVWTVSDEVALDGIDEALRLWLGTRLGAQLTGSGRVTRVVADLSTQAEPNEADPNAADPNAVDPNAVDPNAAGLGGTDLGAADQATVAWTVGLHPGVAEVHRLPVAPDAVAQGTPAAVYAWLWGRAPLDVLRTAGDMAAITELRAALGIAMR